MDTELLQELIKEGINLEELKLLRRQYFGVICATSCNSRPGNNLIDNDVKWAWKTASTMASRLLLSEMNESKLLREAAEKLPLR
jgi:hypothetical protein